MTDTDAWLVIPTGGAPPYRHVCNGPTLDALQTLVGGYVEVIPLDIPCVGEVDVWLNEEGAYSGELVNSRVTRLVKGLSPNTLLMPEGIRGNAVITRANHQGETIPLTDDQVERLEVIVRGL